MTRGRLLLVLTLFGGLLSACDSSTNKATGAREVEPVSLTLANANQGDLDVAHWAKAVDRLSRGEVRIDVRGEWRRGEAQPERGVLADVRAGRVDIGMILSPSWDTLGVDSFQALQAPLLVDSLELQERVLSDELGASMLAGVRAAGVEPVGMLPGWLRRPVGVSRDLRGPGDYRGALIGTPPSALQEATFQALGARVAGENDSGRVDGTEADLATLDFARVDREARSVTADVVLWPRAPTLVINRDVWRGLTAGQRAALEDAAREAAAPVIRMERTFDRGAAISLCDRGFALVRAGAGEMAALRRAVEPVYRDLESDGDTRAAIERIRSLKARTPAAPAPACGSAQDRPAAPSDAPVVGTWQVRVTREQMAAADELPGAPAQGNWGHITLALGADGRFEMHNDRFTGGPIGLGEWSVRGDVLRFVPGGTVEMGAGEIWRYRWTLFRGALVLRRLTREAGPTVLTVAPLHRR